MPEPGGHIDSVPYQALKYTIQQRRSNSLEDSHMNVDVFLLFFNAVITMVMAAAIVIWILRREYLPAIKRLEKSDTRDTDN